MLTCHLNIIKMWMWVRMMKKKHDTKPPRNEKSPWTKSNKTANNRNTSWKTKKKSQLNSRISFTHSRLSAKNKRIHSISNAVIFFFIFVMPIPRKKKHWMDYFFSSFCNQLMATGKNSMPIFFPTIISYKNYHRYKQTSSAYILTHKKKIFN